MLIKIGYFNLAKSREGYIIEGSFGED